MGIKGTSRAQLMKKLKRKHHLKFRKKEMNLYFLLFSLSFGCLIQKKQTVHPVVAVRSSQVGRSRAKRDLIGYNRQRNTAHQSRFKVMDTNHIERYNRKIAMYAMKNDPTVLERFRKQLMVLKKQRRARMLKQLGY